MFHIGFFLAREQKDVRFITNSNNTDIEKTSKYKLFGCSNKILAGNA